jgi:hypothetical protein
MGPFKAAQWSCALLVVEADLPTVEKNCSVRAPAPATSDHACIDPVRIDPLVLDGSVDMPVPPIGTDRQSIGTAGTIVGPLPRLQTMLGLPRISELGVLFVSPRIWCWPGPASGIMMSPFRRCTSMEAPQIMVT